MEMKMSAAKVEIFGDRGLAGCYHLDDPFKPFLHPLNTSAGHCVSAAGPHDHKHHKGLMYALRTSKVNFWEEKATGPGESVGRQRHLGLQDVVSTGDDVGFTQQLAWETSGEAAPIFLEERTIRVRQEGLEFHWMWTTHLTVQAASRLIKSQWSWALPDGRRVNYHGLGLRLVRSFGCTGGNALTIDDQPVAFKEAMGQIARRVRFEGTLDPCWPQWPGPRAAVSIEQHQSNGLFVLESPFAFMGLGPSNLEEVELSAGTILEERYQIRIADVPVAASSTGSGKAS